MKARSLRRQGPPRFVVNARRAGPNRSTLLRQDPSRTQALYKPFARQLTAQFDALKRAVVELVGDRDALGLGQRSSIVDLLTNFDPKQPRDDHGRWTSTGSRVKGQVWSAFGVYGQVSFKTDDSGKVYGEHGSEAVVVNPHLGDKPAKGLNFKAADDVTETSHLIAHELVHKAFSADSSLGHEMMERLSKVNAQYGSSVSMYGAVAGKFENLIELGAAYSHSPDQLKAYSREMYDIADEWAKRVRALTANFNPSQPRDSDGQFASSGGILGALQSAGAVAHHVEEAAKAWVGDKLQRGLDKLPEPARKVVSASWYAAKTATKGAFATWVIGQEMVERVAKEKGLTEEHARRLRGLVSALDVTTLKPVQAVGAAVGMTPVALGVAGFLPPASTAYLLYSTARDPLATLRAAKGLVKDAARATGRGLLKAGNKALDAVDELARLTGNAEPDALAPLLAALDKYGWDDWYLALLHAALDEAGDLPEALTLASSAYTESSSPPTLNAGTDWSFKPNPEKLREFQAWLKQKLGELVANATSEEIWQAYVRDGFERGAGRAWDDVKGKQKAALPSERLPWYEGGRDQFLSQAFGQPESVEKVQLLAQQTWDHLEGVTGDMSTRMGRVLVDGLVTGKGPREVARTLAKAVDLGRERALVVARTEVVRAHAEGQLLALNSLGVTDLGVDVEWAVAAKGACPRCKAHAGQAYTVENASGKIPHHPQCRCCWIPKVPAVTMNAYPSPQEAPASRLRVDDDLRRLSRWLTALNFNPNQPRDEKGKFTKGSKKGKAAPTPDLQPPVPAKPNPTGDRLRGMVEASAGLSPEQKKDYTDEVREATARMPAKAHERIAANLVEAKFYPDQKSMVKGTWEGVRKEIEAGEPRWVRWLGKLPGFRGLKEATLDLERVNFELENVTTVAVYQGAWKTTYLDGGGLMGFPKREVYAHELTHAIDGPERLFSGSPGWSAAFKADIDRHGDPLSTYARTHPAEGFAEFGRAVYAGLVPLRDLEKKFPLASAYFKEQGLWPES